MQNYSDRLLKGDNISLTKVQNIFISHPFLTILFMPLYRIFSFVALNSLQKKIQPDGL